METTYSVKQIACMMGVNEETVRRWIRNRELQVDYYSSKKDGYRVKESELNRFTQNRKKTNKNLLADIIENRFDLVSLDEQILELESLIDSLQDNLETLKRIRDALNGEA